MRADKKLRLPPIVPFMVASIIVILSAGFVGQETIKQMLKNQAQAHAQNMAIYLVGANENIAMINDGGHVLAGVSPLENTQPHLALSAQQWVYGANGSVFNNPTDVKNDTMQSLFPKRDSHIAHQVYRTGEANFTKVDTGQQLFSRVFVPLMKDSQKIGVLEIISDETKTWQHFQDQFYAVVLKMASIVAFAFFVPGFLYLRQLQQLKKSARKLTEKQQYDRLTGALNRTAFTNLTREFLIKAEASGQAANLIVIDVDRFKTVNEQKGQVFGDELLSQVAKRLRFVLGPTEKLARLGGDEFAIFSPRTAQDETSLDVLGHKILSTLAKPFTIMGAEIQINISAGAAVFPRDGQRIDEIDRAANIALIFAKKANNSSFVIFEPGMNSVREERQSIERRLRDALSRNEFSLHYQPFYCVDGKQLAGFEALLRLSHTDGTPIPPSVFVPIAEEIGLIDDIGAWVIKEAASEAVSWPEDLFVSVNLSPLQFQTQNIPKLVRKVLEETGLDAGRLELEVTESVFIDDTQKVLSTLKELKSIGTRLALDDFGTGYSSLNYLWQYPFDKLKIDKSFINDVAHEDHKARDILTAIIALGRALGLSIIAEGVETLEQVDVLRELQCDLIQGYLYSRPLNVTDVHTLLDLRQESFLPQNSANVTRLQVKYAH